MRQTATRGRASPITTAAPQTSSRGLRAASLSTASILPLEATASRLGHHVTQLASSGSAEPPLQLVRNRRRWTPAQHEQSRKFWEKKHAREERNRVSAYIRGKREQTAAELAPIALRGVASGPAGRQNPAAPRGAPLVPPQAAAVLGYKDVASHIGGFLDPVHPIRSTANAGGPQFVQNFPAPLAHVTRRVGVDVEPSPHVAQYRPHLNLQTQLHGAPVQNGPLADPHHPVRSADPFPAGHRLHGLQPEEQRQFLERYLTSSGFQVRRP